MSADEQAALVGWIWAQPEALPPPGLQLPSPRHLAAYREHAKALAVRALAAAYPRVQAWLGDADFAGLAWAYARAHPPRQGDMNRWGQHLAEFLAQLPGMDEEPPALAVFDWHLHQLATAADEPEADPALWQLLGQHDPAVVRLNLSTSLRVFELPRSVSGLLDDEDGGPIWGAWRAGWRPRWASLDSTQATLIHSLRDAPNLAAALQQAAHAAAALGPLLHQGWQQGWLLGAELLNPA
jgi:hypothetical protein